jgi:PAS domain S-box-containing protein
VAYAGFDQGYIDSLKITWNETERGIGPTGTAIRTGKAQVYNDMINDPKFRPWRKQALERGYASSVVLPLMANDKAFGALNIYSPEVNTFGDEEVKLLSELASDFAHGIILLRMQATNKKTQELVQTTLKRFYDSLSSMHGGILLVSDQEKVEFVNQALCDIFNLNETPEQLKELSAEQVIKKIKNSYLHPEQELTRIKEIIECGEPVLGEEVEMQNKRTYLRDFIPLKATEDAPSFSHLWHYMDITPQKSAEETLLKSRGEWERTFDALPDYIAVIDQKHRILRVNKAMADKLGLKPEQCFGMHCYGCVHGSEKWPDDCPHTKSLRDGKIHVAELFEEKLGGDLIVTTTPLKDEKGNVVGTVHVARVKSKKC